MDLRSSPVRAKARCAPRIAADALNALRSGLGEALGSRVEAMEVTVTRERLYSSIHFCRVDLRDGSRRQVVVKIYKPWPESDLAGQQALLARDYEVTSRLCRLLDGQQRFRVPRPLWHSLQHLLIATEWMPGVQLQAKLEARAPWFPGEATQAELERDCRACGEWLRHFQGLTRGQAAAAADLERMRKLVADRLEWSVDAGHIPIDAAQRQRILDRFDRVAEKLKDEDLATASVHGDFFAGNVLISEQQVAGLDFVMAREGSIWCDPSYFVFQVETLGFKPQFRRALLARLRDAFLAGYDPSRSPASFASRPMVQLYRIHHEAMRLGRMLVLERAPLLRRLNNRRIATKAISALCAVTTPELT